MRKSNFREMCFSASPLYFCLHFSAFDLVFLTFSASAVPL
jgi:hypothetical protein